MGKSFFLIVVVSFLIFGCHTLDITTKNISGAIDPANGNASLVIKEITRDNAIELITQLRKKGEISEEGYLKALSYITDMPDRHKKVSISVSGNNIYISPISTQGIINGVREFHR